LENFSETVNLTEAKAQHKSKLWMHRKLIVSELFLS